MTINKTFNLLVVEDDLLIHQALRLCLPSNWRIFPAMSIKDIQWKRMYHAALIDMHLNNVTDFELDPNPEGPSIISRIAKMNPQLEVIGMSGDLSRSLMEECLLAGASRFIGKPLNPEELNLIIQKIEALWEIRSLESQTHTIRWIGKSYESQKVIKAIADLRAEKLPILLEGETGTGKDVAAKLIHLQEGKGPFISVNLAGIPENLFESELFGHLKGSFSGAHSNKIGLTEAAHGGILFLDEIEALPLTQQAKLLRFIESGEIRKVGSKDIQYVQTRIIAASNRSLREMVRKGEFREDLYFRLTSHVIQLPPLRGRLSDIPELIQYFNETIRPKRNKMFSEDGIEALQNYSWPGNVRELKRICEQLSLTSPLPIIRSEDVNKLIGEGNNELLSKADNLDYPNLTLGYEKLVENYQMKIIENCLNTTKCIDKAAEILKISRSHLYKKVRDYGINY